MVGGRHRANTWQGRFPVHNSGDDGFLYTSPVGAFGATELGLTDMGGNVWEWTQDRFRPYAERELPVLPHQAAERAQLAARSCVSRTCATASACRRSHSTPDTSLFHVGFRCARDVDGATRRAD